MSNDLITKADMDDIKAQRIKIEAFTRIINSNPRKVEKHPYTKMDYVPVSEIEMVLDQLFFYQWEWVDVTAELMLNSVVCRGTLIVKHPSIDQWLRRSGGGAVKLQQDKGAKVDDLSKIKPNAFDLAVPVAEAFALKNAAKKFGKIFGRDLNRKFESDFTPLYTPENPAILKKYMDLVTKDCNAIELLDNARKQLNEDELNTLKARITEVKKNG